MERERESSFLELLLFQTVKFFARLCAFLSSNPSPLFSVIVSFYFLLLLYLPNLFLYFIFSPVLISTAIILVTLFRFGSIPKEKEKTFLPESEKSDEKLEDPNRVRTVPDLGPAKNEKDESSLKEIEKSDSKYEDTNRVRAVSDLALIQIEKGEIFLQKCDPTDEESNWVRPVPGLGLTAQEEDATFPPEIGESDFKDDVPNWVASSDERETGMDFVQEVDLTDLFVGWDRGGPLEVIYEEYEGEEHDDPPRNVTDGDLRYVDTDGMLSSAFYYTDSDSSEGEFQVEFPEWDLPENLYFRSEEREGLIEIPLGGKRTGGFELEEENLIEINISSAPSG